MPRATPEVTCDGAHLGDEDARLVDAERVTSVIGAADDGEAKRTARLGDGDALLGEGDES